MDIDKVAEKIYDKQHSFINYIWDKTTGIVIANFKGETQQSNSFVETCKLADIMFSKENNLPKEDIIYFIEYLPKGNVDCNIEKERKVVTLEIFNGKGESVLKKTNFDCGENAVKEAEKIIKYNQEGKQKPSIKALF